MFVTLTTCWNFSILCLWVLILVSQLWFEFIFFRVKLLNELIHGFLRIQNCFIFLTISLATSLILCTLSLRINGTLWAALSTLSSALSISLMTSTWGRVSYLSFVRRPFLHIEGASLLDNQISLVVESLHNEVINIEF